MRIREASHLRRAPRSRSAVADDGGSVRPRRESSSRARRTAPATGGASSLIVCACGATPLMPRFKARVEGRVVVAEDAAGEHDLDVQLRHVEPADQRSGHRGKLIGKSIDDRSRDGVAAGRLGKDERREIITRSPGSVRSRNRASSAAGDLTPKKRGTDLSKDCPWAAPVAATDGGADRCRPMPPPPPQSPAIHRRLESDRACHRADRTRVDALAAHEADAPAGRRTCTQRADMCR